jgi:ABC-2 type transport system permease protein
MLTGLWKLTWLEIKIFLREPLGVFGTIGMPVFVFLGLGRFLVGRGPMPPEAGVFVTIILPVFASLLIAIGAVQSLVTIVSIYREAGILKRLRATPLRPLTILSAQVIVKLLLTAITMTVMIAAGKRYVPAGASVPVAGFALALFLTTISILSVGFVIASVVPTARFAQPIASLVFYPMFALAMIPPAALPLPLRAVSHLLPLTYAVSLMRGIVAGEAWSAHGVDVLGLVVVFLACTALSSRIFRWE